MTDVDKNVLHHTMAVALEGIRIQYPASALAWVIVIEAAVSTKACSWNLPLIVMLNAVTYKLASAHCSL
jgi:hypothetical protein